MSTFAIAWSELIGLVDGIDPFSARKFVQRSYADICSRREWGFLRARAVVQIPNVVSAGAVAVTQFLDTIQFDATAAAVLDVFGLTPSVAQCQIKISTSGGPYSITSYTAGGAAVLDRAYQEATNAASAYTLLRCYVTPPADFLRFISINDPLRGWPLVFGPRWTQQTLDKIDSQRSQGGDPRVFATFVYRDGQTQYEVWPHPTVGRALLTEYRRRGAELGATEAIPDAIGMDLLMSRAKYRAYEFGAGKAASASKAQVFIALMREANSDYEDKLRRYIQLDKAQNPDTIVVSSDQDFWPLDADYMQSHLGAWGWDGYGGSY